MPTAPLGPRGPVVTRLGLGTMTFGAETPEAEAHAQLDAFVAAGGTFVDTADVYAGGESERIVGRWLADRGADVVIGTKGRFAPPSGSAGASRRALARAVQGSLDRLGVDALDLYTVHGWDDHTPVEETLDALSSEVRRGRVHAIGWSNVTGWQLGRIMATARLGGYVVPTAVQPQYNLLDRTIELEIVPAALAEGIALTPWGPLGGGWLTGKYRSDERPSGATRLGEDPHRGVEAYDVRNTDRTWRVVDAVRSVAAAHDRPMAHVAHAWLLSRPTVASVLLGARTTEQLAQSLEAATLELSADDLALLGDASAPGLPSYPYGMVQDACGVDVWRRLGTAAPTD
ncbi:aldo/keto reductase [Phycicoccus sp. BSK3Z-2]|uniref:Aldo/keto reductase n=2 Tax=Phycicoccus avicenniae TaxID=2828860 RepID=A0A941DAF6_9MICO|nr:aldo/keto reductase [Phycicoccus avicenniae]